MIDMISFKEAVQTRVLVPGLYKIECFGAQGGRALDDAVLTPEGGLGAYTSGVLRIKKTTTLYFYTGGKGGDGSAERNVKAKGGYNGGGKGGAETGAWPDNSDAPGGGGGATDVRYKKDDLSTRIMVAGGGSGGALIFQGAPGGDNSCKKLIYNNDKTEYMNVNCSSTEKGEDGKDSPNVPSSGGGGGWQGGAASEVSDVFDCDSDSWRQVSAGGSSYVSGMNGFDVNELYKFTDVKIELGQNAGDGFIQLTRIYKKTIHMKRIYNRIRYVLI